MTCQTNQEHVRKCSSESAHYLIYNQPDATDSEVCQCQVNPYSKKIHIQIQQIIIKNTASVKRLHLQIHQQFITSVIHHTTFYREVQILRHSYTAPSEQGQTQGTRTGHSVLEPESTPHHDIANDVGRLAGSIPHHDSNRQDDDTPLYLWMSKNN